MSCRDPAFETTRSSVRFSTALTGALLAAALAVLPGPADAAFAFRKPLVVQGTRIVGGPHTRLSGSRQHRRSQSPLGCLRRQRAQRQRLRHRVPGQRPRHDPRPRDRAVHAFHWCARGLGAVADRDERHETSPSTSTMAIPRSPARATIRGGSGTRTTAMCITWERAAPRIRPTRRRTRCPPRATPRPTGPSSTPTPPAGWIGSALDLQSGPVVPPLGRSSPRPPPICASPMGASRPTPPSPWRSGSVPTQGNRHVLRNPYQGTRIGHQLDRQLHAERGTSTTVSASAGTSPRAT